MSQDMLKLGFDVDSRKVRTATDDVGKFGRAGTAAGSSISKATKKMNTGFDGVALAAGAALTAMLSIGTAIRTIAEFESSVSKMGAISGATTAQLERMRDVAKDLGSTTEFSATQAADGLTFLAMAGFEAAEAMAAIPAVLDLATASGMGLAQAADTASNIMSGFGIAAENAANVADVLAAASSRSNTSVTQLGGAMSTVAPIAKALDISLADTAAAIGVMSDAGIQGERAGTAMRGVLASLAGPTTQATEVLTRLGLTIEDIDPATNSLSTVMGRLGESGLSTADAMTIFGREAASGALVLIDGAQRLGEFGNELRNVDGAAGDMAATMRDNLGGDIKTLQSAVSGLILALGEAGLTAILRGLLKTITFVARAVTGMIDAFVSARDAVTGFVGDLFSVQSPAEKLALGMQAAEMAIDNSTIAMGDQIAQSASLASRLSDGNVITLESARVNLISAQARIADSEAAERQAEVQARTLLGADKAFSDVIGTTQALTEARNRLTAADIEGAAVYGDLYNSDTLSLVAELEAKLVRQLAAQKAINEALNAMEFLNPEQKAAQEQAAANIALLTPLIEEAQGNLISLNGEIVIGVGLSDRLGSNFDMYTGQLNSSSGAAGGLSGALSTAVGLSATLLRNLGMVPAALQGMTNRAAGVIQSMQETNAALNYQVTEGLSSAAATIKAQGDAAIAAAVANGVNVQSIAAMSSAYAEMVTEAETLAGSSEALSATLNDVTTASEDAGGATADTTTAIERQISALEDAADPLRTFNRGMAELDALKLKGLSDGAYAAAVQELTDRLRDADGAAGGFAKTFSDGFNEMFDYVLDGMKNGMDGLMDILKNTLIAMIKYAVMNPINMQGSMNMAGGSGGGMGGSIMGGVSAGFGGGGVGALTGLGALGGGFGAAGSALLSGGPSMMMASISGQVAAAGAATAGAGAAMAAIGAVALPLLAVAGIFMAFKKTTKDLETGMRVTVDGMDTLVESYKKVRTSQFFGLSKKIGDEFAALGDAEADPVRNAVHELQQGVADAAASLGIGAEVFDGFTRSFTLSLKHMSDDEAQAALAAELFNTQQAFADLIPTLTDFKIEGESTTGTLTRLISNLGTVNENLYLFDQSTLELSLASAGAASELIILSGGLDAFATKTQFVFANMLTNIQQDTRLTEIATDKLNGTLGALGIVIPETHAEFMALLNSQDLLTVGGRNTHAALLDVAGAFVQVYGTAQNAANALSGLDAFMADHYQGLEDDLNDAKQNLATATTNLESAFAREMEATRDTFAAKIDELQESLSGARQRLETSSAIADALGGALGDRLFPSVEAQRQSQDTAAAYLQSLVGMGEINDVEALQNALKAVADPSSKTYTTLEDYRRDFEITSGVIRALEQKAALTLSADEQSVLLLEQQIADTQAQSDIAVDLLQQQLDALLGFEDSIQTLATAIDAFQVALAAMKFATAAASGGSVSAGLSAEQAYLANNPDVLAAVADGRFGSGADHFQNFGKGEGRDFGGGVSAILSNEQAYLASNPDVLNAVASGMFSSAADHFQQFGKAEGRTFGLPAFADGGEHSGGWRVVGERGPELEYTGPSQIASSGTSKSLFDDSGMVEELRMLRDEVSVLKQISMTTARSTQTSADLAEKRDQIGTDRSNAGEAILVKVVT